MDRILRRAFDTIALDNTSGAAELASRAARALTAWLGRVSSITSTQLLDAACELVQARTSMAPLLRIANSVALAAERPDARTRLLQELSAIPHSLQDSRERIGRQFAQAVRVRSRPVVVTYSYSSTVVDALLRARRHIAAVVCSEGRPNFEGRATAERLSAAGMCVAYLSDAALISEAARRDLVVLGADAVLADTFVSKVGSDSIVARATRARRPVWVLADTLKFWPEDPRAFDLLVWLDGGPPEELWRTRRPVNVWNYYFGLAPFTPSVLVLTERGWMRPAQVRREVGKIRISPRLRELVD